MNKESFRRRIEAVRRAADEEANRLKDPYSVHERLRDLYVSLSSDERAIANEVLADWTLSDDEGFRFDSLALIDEFKIAEVLPALHQLAMRLRSSTAPGAYYEALKVDRVIDKVSRS